MVLLNPINLIEIEIVEGFLFTFVEDIPSKELERKLSSE